MRRSEEKFGKEITKIRNNVKRKRKRLQRKRKANGKWAKFRENLYSLFSEGGWGGGVYYNFRKIGNGERFPKLRISADVRCGKNMTMVKETGRK
jgi:hypothetical protein